VNTKTFIYFCSEGKLYLENALSFLQGLLDIHSYFVKYSNNIFYNKNFTLDLFQRWNEAKVAHCVTLILFSRTWYPDFQVKKTQLSNVNCF
jgi:hypothetical protein